MRVCLCSVCVCGYMFARHMALSCPGTVLCSPDVLLFYHPPLAPCSLRFLRICAAHIQLALLFSAVFVGGGTAFSSKPFCFLSEEGRFPPDDCFGGVACIK